VVVTKQGQVLALDAKITFDDNAMFRHKDLEALRDEAEEDPAETEAKKYDLSYISLEGNIGCMVNGAGLAMSTDGHHQVLRRLSRRTSSMSAAAPTAEKVTRAFKIITQRPGGEGHLRQHLRRHHEVRHHRQRRHPAGGEGGRPQDAR
jgi:succinyl-CoA synthetase beta subunit